MIFLLLPWLVLSINCRIPCCSYISIVWSAYLLWDYRTVFREIPLYIYIWDYGMVSREIPCSTYLLWDYRTVFWETPLFWIFTSGLQNGFPGDPLAHLCLGLWDSILGDPLSLSLCFELLLSLILSLCKHYMWCLFLSLYLLVGMNYVRTLAWAYTWLSTLIG